MAGSAVRIGTVWDRTVDVLQGRAGILAAIAALYIFLPGIVGGLIRALLVPAAAPTGGAALIAGLVTLAAGLLLICGMLALTAVASDPAVGSGAAHAIAWRRLPAGLGVILLVILAVAVVALPMMLLLLQAGASYDPATSRLDVSRADPTTSGIAALVTILLLVVGLWVSARLAPLLAVIVNERLGLGAFARSSRLTHGAALRLIGVLILYMIVTVVLSSAVTMVVGVVARLLLGGEANVGVAMIVGIANAIVTCFVTVVQIVFYTQFYVAARDVTGRAEPVA